VANVNCFQILAQNDIIDAQAWIHKNNFMWCILLHLYNCTSLRIFAHFCAHVHLHSRGRGWHSDMSWSFFKLEEVQQIARVHKNNFMFWALLHLYNCIFLRIFETWRIAIILLKITPPLDRVECAKTRTKVLCSGKQLLPS
jgi:hypothetical protein